MYGHTSNAWNRQRSLYTVWSRFLIQLDMMATTAKLEKQGSDNSTSDDAVLEQLGYTQGNILYRLWKSILTYDRA
jgi:hypothetical protein